MVQSVKRFLPHLLVIFGFILVSVIYFYPVLQGKKIFQSDIMHYIGMAEQQKAFAQKNGEETYWTNSAFGGMPTYQLGAKYPHNYIKKLDLALRFLPRPADYLFLYLIGFYIFLCALKVDYRLSAIGALAFGLSTYLIIILGVGHNSKAHAIAYMPLVLAGIVLTFRRKYLLGFIVTTLGLGLELVANHFQMTYYLLLLVLILGLVYAIEAFKSKTLDRFFKSLAVLVVGAVLAVGLNATNILATKEYVKVSTRGKTELTVNPDGSSKVATNGLDKDYITEYSYGILETFNLFIPNFMGGGSYEDVGKDSETYRAFIKLGASPIDALNQARSAPMYWGDQPIVEAPAYIGAAIIFLFIIGLVLVKGRAKKWLLFGAILSLLLSYGKNLDFLTTLFIDYVPLYDKFRAVSSIQVILELCVPALAILGLAKFLSKTTSDTERLTALKYALGIAGGLALIFLVFKTSLFDFASARDGQYRQYYGQEFVDALIEDRIALFTQDSLRSLVLVLFSTALLFGFWKQKLSKNMALIGIAIIIVVDLALVDLRYVNSDSFVSAIQVDKPYRPNAADKEILKDKGHYRVLDLSNEGQRAPARAAYFHNSLTGYHAAKIGRIDELLDFYVYQNNLNVINMLNTKYIIAEDENNAIFAYENEQANGNAWFVKSIKTVETANEELLILDSLETKNTAVLRVAIAEKFNIRKSYQVDSTSNIELKEFNPKYLKYQSVSTNDSYAVFSEVYYGQGWQAYLNGKQVDHQQVNYVLRGMPIPAGSHTIEFKFEPQVIATGSKIALGSSLAVVLIFGLGLFKLFKSRP
jgi:hypothetical protein